jgi:tetratricopeptide (TPR) repeat protein
MNSKKNSIIILTLLLFGLLSLAFFYTPNRHGVKNINLENVEKSAIEAEEEGNISRAAAIWQKLAGYNPRSPHYLYRYGRTLSWSGHYRAARSFLQRALHYDPENAGILLQFGLTELKMGRYEDAEGYFQKVLALDPENAAVPPIREMLSLNTAPPEEVQKDLWWGDDFALARSLLKKSEELYEQGRYDQSLPLLTTIYYLHPQFAVTYYQLGKTYAALKKNAQAEAFLVKSIALDPENTEALTLLAKVQLALGEQKEAEPVYREEPEAPEKNALIRKNLVRAALEYEREEKHEKALRIWRGLAEEFTDSEHLKYRTGLSYYRRNMYEEAFHWLQKSLAINPEQADALVFLGLVQLQMEKPTDAAESFTKALEIAPDYKDALKGLDRAHKAMYALKGEKLEEEQKWEEAAEFWTQLAVKFPQSAYFSHQAGNAYYRLEQYREAAEWLEKSLTIEPDNADALVILGYAHLRMNNFTEALEAFSQALALAPDYEGAIEGIEITKKSQLEHKVKNDVLAQQVLKRAEKLRDEFKFDAAYPLWTWLLNRYETFPLFSYSLGNNYLARGKYYQAEWMLRRALELNPKAEDPWIKLGYTYLDRARLYQACSIFEYSTQEFSKSGQAHLGMARTYRGAHLVCKAKQAYKKAIHYLDYYPDQAVAERELQHLRRHTDPNFYAFTAFGREVETDLITDVKSADRRTMVNLFEYWHPFSQRTRLMAFAQVGFDREIAIQQDVNNFFIDEHAGGVGFDHYATPWLNLQAFIRVKQGIDARETSQFPFQNTTRVEPRSLLQYRYLSHRLFLSSEVDSFIVKDFARFNSFYLTRWKNEFTYQYQWRPMSMFLGCTGFIRKYDDGNQQLDGKIFFQFPYPKYGDWLWVRQELRTGAFTNTRVDYYSYRELWEYSAQAAVFKYIFPTTYAEFSYLHAWRNTRDLQQPVTSPVFVPELFLNINKVFFNLKQMWKSDLEIWIRSDYYWDSADYTAYTIRAQLYYNF